MNSNQSLTAPALVKKIAEQIESTRTAPAWWVLETITSKSQAQLLAADTITLTDNEHKRLNQAITNIVEKKMPLQYALQKIPFGDLTLHIEPPIHIPRPETEEWCSRFAEQIKQSGATNLRILDLCTGSGCIALSLAHKLPDAEVIGTDINPDAVALAQKNAATNNVTNVSFHVSNLFDAFDPSQEKFDIIVANPPYVTEEEWKELDPQITRWEDKKAFVASDEGLAILRAIIADAHLFIRNNRSLQAAAIAQLVLEIGHMQAQPVVQYMLKHTYEKVHVCNDFAGKSRTVLGRVVNVVPITTEA